jgi:hypothetical protein
MMERGWGVTGVAAAMLSAARRMERKVFMVR